MYANAGEFTTPVGCKLGLAKRGLAYLLHRIQYYLGLVVIHGSFALHENEILLK